MKTIRFLSIFLQLIFASYFHYGQQSAIFGDVSHEIRLGRELFYQGKFNAAYHQFEQVQGLVNPASERWAEAEYYKAVSALKASHASGSRMLERFLKEHASSPYKNQALIAMGDYQFEKKQYGALLRTYGEVDPARMSEEERVRMKYQKGYAHLMQEESDLALAEFYAVKDLNQIYSRPATYYYAHIMYLQENYQSALDEFRKLEDDPAFSRVIPLYVSQIYYKQERFSDVISYTVPILDAVGEEHRTELAKVIGDSYFHLREFEKALPYLERYFASPGPKSREDNYLLGYVYYYTGTFDKAVPHLESASKGKDEMAQNAFYHLADCYIRQENKESARMAFEAASEMEFNDRIREDALFNYAKLTYEISYSPFNETIKAFDRYITLYPNTERNSEAYRYLTEVFMVTRNYQDAINTIEKIAVQTPDIKRAYQRVTFLRGMELFNNFAYHSAIEHFDLSMKHGTYDRELNARALFWKAEALYRVGVYRPSAETYAQFMRTPGAFALPEFKDAEYNLAYARFKLEEYNQAATHFRNFINATQSQKSDKLADAYNRLGDYYFYTMEYGLARQNYQQAYDLNRFDADYALYQIAFCQGLQHDQPGKIASLKKLQSGFPESEYFDDALFELGRAYERIGQADEAAAYYRRIIDSHTESAFYPRALLQLGLINYNNGDFNAALTDYKRVAEKFPGTSEAQAALLGIRNCYVEMSNVEGYFAYTRSLGGGVDVSDSEQDSLTYASAERLYMNGDPKASQQLQHYLRQFPNGSFTMNANFYLAELLYKEGDYAQANTHYTLVARQPNNIFSEQALSRASELHFNTGDYAQALEFFERLERVAGSKWNLLKAYAGSMRCYFNLKRYSDAITAAEKVKRSEVANDAWVREADFVLGKSYLLSGNQNAALQPLIAVAADTKSEQGAEAKFRVAEIYFQQNQKEQAEKEIMDFISKGTPFQFWLGKAFLLLADIYLDRGDDFQARHTLRSLVENYNADNDGVRAEASKKLAALEAIDASEQQRAKDSSFQMKINGN